MKNNLQAQFYAFITVIMTLFIIALLAKPNVCNAQSQMYVPESAVAVQVDITNATVVPTKGSRIIIETTVQLANGKTVAVVTERTKPIIIETNGVVKISQPKTVKVNGENVSIHHRIYIPKTLKLNA